MVPLEELRLLTAKEVAGMVGVRYITLWRWQKEGTFPKARRIGPQRIGWPLAEIRAWLESRPTERAAS